MHYPLSNGRTCCLTLANYQDRERPTNQLIFSHRGWQVGNSKCSAKIRFSTNDQINLRLAASIGYLAGTVIQGLVILNNPSYEPKAWESTLLIWAVLTFSIIFNTFFASKLPILEIIVLFLHILGFFAILVTLWVLGDRPKPASEIFFSFTDGGQWGNMGLSCLVGMLSPVFSFIGPDSATHIAEELRDASRTLPLAMMWTATVNGAMGFVMLCTFVMLIPDVEAALNSRTGYAFIDVFYNATGSNAGASAMTSILIIMMLFGCVTSFATSSRQLWAFVSHHHKMSTGKADCELVERSWNAVLILACVRSAWVGCTHELYHLLVRLRHAAITNQPWKRRCSEHYHVTWYWRIALLLYCFY